MGLPPVQGILNCPSLPRQSHRSLGLPLTPPSPHLMGRGRRNFGGFNPGWRSSDELTPGYFLAALSGRFPRGHPLVLGQSRGWAWRSEVERNELSNLCSVTADRQDQTTSLRRVPAEPCRYLARNEPQANAAQVAARGRARVRAGRAIRGSVGSEWCCA